LHPTRQTLRVLFITPGDGEDAQASTNIESVPSRWQRVTSTGTRAYQGTRKLAKTHVPKLKFPAPATVATWVSGRRGPPLVIMAALAGELRRLIAEQRAIVGDSSRVLVGFDRGGWSPALFADLHAAGFDIYARLPIGRKVLLRTTFAETLRGRQL
jgi:hypothetical protein